MNWSRPAAKFLLRFFREHGGSATTKQISTALGDSQAAHTDVHSVRCYAWEELGFPRHENPVGKGYERTYEDERGRTRRVYRYKLDARLMKPTRFERGLAPDPAEFRREPQVNAEEREPQTVGQQGALFPTRSQTAEAQRARGLH